jgi:hypothetical protein
MEEMIEGFTVRVDDKGVDDGVDKGDAFGLTVGIEGECTGDVFCIAEAILESIILLPHPVTKMLTATSNELHTITNLLNINIPTP